MELGHLYQFILTIVLVGMLLGVGFVVLANFQSSAAVGHNSTAETALNNTQNAMSTIPQTWLPLIVTIAVLAIVLGLVIRSFAGQEAR